MRAGQIRVGTSGWSYPHWRKRFYPAGLPAHAWLPFYQQQFPTVEINTTFYRLPVARTVNAWREKALPRFEYAVKGSRFITHTRRLDDCATAVRHLLDRLKPIRSSLSVVLWQLPPDFERNDDTLEAFLRILPARPRNAMEFRHASWFDEQVYELLARYRVAFVAASSKTDTPRVATTDFVYVRFHGLHGDYAHNYTEAELHPWVRWLEEVAREGRDGYVFFNNDGLARAPSNAHRLADLLGQVAFPWP